MANSPVEFKEISLSCGAILNFVKKNILPNSHLIYAIPIDGIVGYNEMLSIKSDLNWVTTCMSLVPNNNV